MIAIQVDLLIGLVQYSQWLDTSSSSKIWFFFINSSVHCDRTPSSKRLEAGLTLNSLGSCTTDTQVKLHLETLISAVHIELLLISIVW